MTVSYHLWLNHWMDFEQDQKQAAKDLQDLVVAVDGCDADFGDDAAGWDEGNSQKEMKEA